MPDNIFSLTAPEVNSLNAHQFKAVSDIFTSNAMSGIVNAGQTYIGQMVSHDLTADKKVPQRVVKPYLDLSSLYGERGNHDSDLFDDLGHFKYGYSLNGKYIDFDLDRDLSNGLANIPDRRNDENMLISQLHLLWLRLHNQVLDKHIIPFSPGNSSEKNISHARKLVTILFQKVVVEDFLADLIHVDVLKEYSQGKEFKNEYLNSSNLKQAPDIFSKAVFRAGHSMVRDKYVLGRQSGSKSLIDLMSVIDDVGTPNWSLSRHHRKIDWSVLFGKGKDPAHRIDTNIAASMTKVPSIQDSIINANLNAGNASSLPPGHLLKVILESDISPFAGAVEFVDVDIPPTLADKGITEENLPLWLFTLLEADSYAYVGPVRGDSAVENRGTGAKFGPVASIVIMEVLANAIQHSEDSYYKLSELDDRDQEFIRGFKKPNDFSVMNAVIDYVG